jgi:hypothetical protein
VREKISVTNGDLAALKKIAQEYGISDAANVITFAIGILNHTGGKAVFPSINKSTCESDESSGPTSLKINSGVHSARLPVAVWYVQHWRKSLSPM